MSLLSLAKICLRPLLFPNLSLFSKKIQTKTFTTMASNNKAAGRVLLPLTINPIRYDVKLTPDLENYTFSGVTTIELSTTADVNTSDIVMHAKELCFANASYIVKGATEVVHEAEEITINSKSTTVSFGFTTSIPKNSTLIMTISYNGFLNNQMAGFYRSSYTNIHGEKKIMASTQFESLDARRAFPCWDEPARSKFYNIISAYIDGNLFYLEFVLGGLAQHKYDYFLICSTHTQIHKNSSLFFFSTRGNLWCYTSSTQTSRCLL